MLLAQFRQSLLRSFSQEELTLLCSDCGVNPDSIPNRQSGIEIWAQEIIAYFQRRDELSKLLQRCQELRPSSNWFELDRSSQSPASVATSPLVSSPIAPFASFLQAPEVTPVPSSASNEVSSGKPWVATESVKKGLFALHELAAQKDIARIVGGAQTDLRNAFDQIAFLVDYKQLHDELHQLQFGCYNFLARSQDRFPDDEVFLENLIDYEAAFGRTVDVLKEISTRPNIKNANELTWILKLEQALQFLQDARDELDSALFARCVSMLRSILNTQPSRINTILVTAARNVRFENLVVTLKRLSTVILQSELSADDIERARQFAASVDALVVLGQAFGQQVTLHDRWQEIVNNLQEIDADPAHKLIDELRWQDLTEMAHPLYANGVDDWLTTLRNAEHKLQDAIDTADRKVITLRYKAYRSQADNCFFQVDKKLRDMCAYLTIDIRPQLSHLLDLVG